MPIETVLYAIQEQSRLKEAQHIFSSNRRWLLWESELFEGAQNKLGWIVGMEYSIGGELYNVELDLGRGKRYMFPHNDSRSRTAGWYRGIELPFVVFGGRVIT